MNRIVKWALWVGEQAALMVVCTVLVVRQAQPGWLIWVVAGWYLVAAGMAKAAADRLTAERAVAPEGVVPAKTPGAVAPSLGVVVAVGFLAGVAGGLWSRRTRR